MFYDGCMAIAPRCHQHPVCQLAAIVQDGIPRKRGHVTIRFLHDQIGRCKVPIVALTTCECGIKRPMSDPT